MCLHVVKLRDLTPGAEREMLHSAKLVCISLQSKDASILEGYCMRHEARLLRHLPRDGAIAVQDKVYHLSELLHLPSERPKKYRYLCANRNRVCYQWRALSTWTPHCRHLNLPLREKFGLST